MLGKSYSPWTCKGAGVWAEPRAAWGLSQNEPALAPLGTGVGIQTLLLGLLGTSWLKKDEDFWSPQAWHWARLAWTPGPVRDRSFWLSWTLCSYLELDGDWLISSQGLWSQGMLQRVSGCGRGLPPCPACTQSQGLQGLVYHTDPESLPNQPPGWEPLGVILPAPISHSFTNRT